ncbi:hypothetical protein F5X96DRAFT_650667 [Biscogniauxia mediterranea]|nr:hypothetical protein F5X96DRAFT_650667 [Biscogniauxia mediterranea]
MKLPQHSNTKVLAMRSLLATFVLGAFAPYAAAVIVADGSPCEIQCGNVLDSTTPDMIVCDEYDYSVTSAGKVFDACVTCESTSPYETTEGGKNVTDLQYLLYNLRYATSQCLFEAASGPCVTTTACGPLRDAVEYGNLSSSVTLYGYCSLWSDYQLEKCTDCLSAWSEGHYLHNFMSILSGACRLRLEPPATLPLQGQIFSTDLVNVTDPTPTATFAAVGSTGPLSNGEIAGVVAGGIVVLLVIVGCGVVLNGKRRRKSYLRKREQLRKNWPSPQGGGEMFETPVSQRPLRGGAWGDSPVSAATADGSYPYPRYFSPYTSQYNSPVSAAESSTHAAWTPQEKAQNIGVALSPDTEASHPWSDSKGKEKERMDMEREAYEMQEGVNSSDAYGHALHTPPLQAYHPPVLNHPGYGRQGQAVRRASEDETPYPGEAR